MKNSKKYEYSKIDHLINLIKSHGVKIDDMYKTFKK